MSHPKDRRHRFIIGQRKGERRAVGYSPYFFHSDEDKKRWIRFRRNTTTLCSCSMCGNPRRNEWGKARLTMQERKFKEACEKYFLEYGIKE